MKKWINLLFSFIAIFSLSSCASLMPGKYQRVTVSTDPINGTCTLHNDKGNWRINNTPETTTVRRSRNPLQVMCYKDGFYPNAKTINSYSSTEKLGSGYTNPILIKLTPQRESTLFHHHHRGRYYAPASQHHYGYDAKTAKY